MSDIIEIRPIAHIESDFHDKFGIPRQAGLVEALEARVVFTPEYRVDEALRGIESFSHLWLIWQFSEAVRGDWSPTVRPPRLGGNTRMGVFATRSPFRPYIPYSDAHPEAVSGFAPDAGRKLTVVIPEALMCRIRADKLEALRGVLANDPRPRYQDDPARVYAMDFAGMNIKFTVCGDTLTVTEIEKSELN